MNRALLQQAINIIGYYASVCDEDDQDTPAKQTIRAIKAELEKTEYRPYVPKCSGCGSTENLHKDYGSGGPYRCNSPDCMIL